MYDTLEVLSALVTNSAGASGTGVNLGTGTPRRGLKARVILTNASQSAANGVVTFTVDHSTDNTTFTTLSTSDPITNSTTAVTKEIFIPFETNKQYVRLTMANTVSTGTAAISYKADIGLTRPG